MTRAVRPLAVRPTLAVTREPNGTGFRELPRSQVNIFDEPSGGAEARRGYLGRLARGDGNVFDTPRAAPIINFDHSA